jgi:hypothetical protein
MGQSCKWQAFTSLELPAQHSKHFNRIAFNGLTRFTSFSLIGFFPVIFCAFSK